MIQLLIFIVVFLLRVSPSLSSPEELVVFLLSCSEFLYFAFLLFSLFPSGV